MKYVDEYRDPQDRARHRPERFAKKSRAHGFSWKYAAARPIR